MLGVRFIGKIHPRHQSGIAIVLVTIDYFTKWIEPVPLKNMTHSKVTEFITNQGTSFL